MNTVEKGAAEKNENPSEQTRLMPELTMGEVRKQTV